MSGPLMNTGEHRAIRALEAETLARIARELARAEGDVTQAFEAIVTGALGLVGATGALVNTVADGLFHVECARGSLAKFEDLTAPLVEHSLAYAAIADRRSVIANDPADPRMDARFSTLLHNVIVAPMLVEDTVVGCLIAANRATPFDEVHAELLDRLADLGALTVRNTRLYATAQRHAREMRALDEIVHQLNASLEPGRVFDMIARHAAELVGARGARVTLVDGAALKVMALHGEAGDPPEGGRFAAAGTVSDEVIRTQRPLRVANIAEHAAQWPESVRQAGKAALSVLAVPMLVSDRPIGAIVVYGSAGQLFGAEDERILDALGDHAAMAIENARLFHAAAHEREIAEIGGAIARAALLGLEPTALADRIVCLLEPLLGDARLCIARLDDKAVALQMLSPASPELLPVTAGTLREVLESARAATLDANADAWLGKCAWVLPLVARRQVIGVLAASALDGGKLPDGVTSALARLGDEVSLAIDAAMQGEARVQQYERESSTAKMAALGELVAGVAHELNNPLTGISAFAQLLLEDALKPDQHEAVLLIKREADRAVSVIRDLNLFARKSDPRRVLVNLNALVEFTLRLRAYALRSAGITVRTELDPSLPSVIGDDRKLQQVLLNLVVNAEHAMQATERKELLLHSEQRAGEVAITVRDTGTGMSDDVVGHIFEPFFTTKPEGTGTGLGLSVSYGIVQRHGGTLSVESTPGVGTAFCMALPLSG